MSTMAAVFRSHDGDLISALGLAPHKTSCCPNSVIYPMAQFPVGGSREALPFIMERSVITGCSIQ